MEAVGSEAVSSSTSKASAFSCAIEVIVDSTPPKSVHRGDGDRAEFAIQLKMPHTAASSRCFLAGGIVADISRMLTGHQFQDHGDQVDKSWVEHHTMNFTSHGETFLPDEETDSERQDCFLISHLFGVMGHGQRKKAEAPQLSIDDIV